MSLRRTLRALLRVSVVGSIALALPISIGVDPDKPVVAPPLAATLLLGGSSTLLAIAGCVLRKRHAAPATDAKPFA